MKLQESLPIALILAGAGIGYYFGIFLPKQKTVETEQSHQAFLLEKKEQCQRVGKVLYDDLVKDPGDNSVFNAQYAYNEKLNTCLYSSGLISKNSLLEWVMDSYTNKEILNYTEINKQPLTVGGAYVNTKAEFEQRKAELMGL